MLLSLIICSRNRADALDETLSSLACVVLPKGLDVELIVADNGSTDSTHYVISRHRLFGKPIIQLQVPQGGKSVALNAAVARSRGHVLAFTDDDIRPDPDWLVHLTQPLLTGRFDAVAGTISLAPHLQRDWMRPLHRAWLAATDYLDPRHPGTLVGANMAFSREVLNSVPAFDPELGPGQLGLWEDTLYSLQLREAGYRLGMAETARIVHHFEPQRLQRIAFHRRARSEGMSSAYVAWHWRHAPSAVSPVRTAKWYLHLLLKRLLRWSEWHQSEGMPLWEINLLTGIEYERHLRRLSHMPRKYAKFGFRKCDSFSVGCR